MAKTKSKAKSPKKGSRNGGFFFGGGRHRLLASIMVFLLLAASFGSTFVPEESVPEPLRNIHASLLATRNGLIAKSGLPISRYEDAFQLENPGSAPVKLYFAPSPGISRSLCEFIDSARDSLDVCIYDLDLEDAAGALIRAYQRNLKVRVITDDSNADLAAVKALEKAGIPVRNDNRASLMHNKFMVADATRVWTGSFNFTSNGALKNDNNVLALESPALANAYMEKFDEYWSGKFSFEASLVTREPKLLVGKIPVEVAFSPSDRVRKKILEELDFVKERLDIMAFSLTSDEIAGKLKDLAKRGVEIRCLLDASTTGSAFSKDQYLKGLGVKVRISPNTSGKMHHKVMILDGETVLTGSYNFSNNAEKYNDENILILRSPALAKKYEEEFRRCWMGTKGY